MKIPFLKNFRRGFATNSSSSHSFVYLKEPVPGAHDNHVVDVDDFGWNDFRLDTIKEKLFYVLASRIGGMWNPKDEEIEELWQEHKDEYPELDRDDFAQAITVTVDHQSKGLISESMARDPHLVVFGGNDNSDGSYERKEVIKSGLVDWSRTTPEYEDADLIPDEDTEAREKLYERYPYLREEEENEND